MDAPTFKSKIQLPPNGQGRKDGTVALRYKIKDDAFELDGWQVAKQGNNFFFNQASKISFQKGIATQVPISSGDDLGSIIMGQKLVSDILNAINTNNYGFLVLVPTKSGNMINYEVKLSNSPSGLITEFQGKDSMEFKSIKIGDMDDPIPPGGGGILNN
jgi:hypothetical protein